MRLLYLDTSALRHLLVQSSATEVVAEALRGPDRVTASSALVLTELHRLGQLSAGVSVQDVDDVLDKVDLIPVSPDQLRAAGLLPALAAGTQLRSLDAIHIQAALDFGAVEFLTSDRRQAEAATAARLPVTLL